MHARKDRRILEEKRHGGCAAGGEQTAAQQETLSGRKGPQASVAFSGHNPRRTRRAQHGIFGERSFRRLRYLCWNWTQYLVRPDSPGWPVIGKPLHRRIEASNVNISACTQRREFLAIAENTIANSFLFRLNGRSIQFRDAE